MGREREPRAPGRRPAGDKTPSWKGASLPADRSGPAEPFSLKFLTHKTATLKPLGVKVVCFAAIKS